MVILLLLLGYLVAAVLLVTFLMKHDHGAKEPFWPLVEAAGLGFLGLLLGLGLEFVLISHRELLLVRFISSGDSRAIVAGLTAFLKVGIIEEFVKFGPLVWLIYRRPYFNEYTDGVIYFSLAGLAFGFGENLSYLLRLGTGVGLMRLILMPYFHAALTGIVGFYVARQKVRGGRLWSPTLLLAIGAAMLTHAVYDFSMASGNPILIVVGLMILALLTTSLVLYDQKADELDRATLPSTTGVDRFCRHCGRSNIHGTHYCEYCGQVA